MPISPDLPLSDPLEPSEELPIEESASPFADLTFFSLRFLRRRLGLLSTEESESLELYQISTKRIFKVQFDCFYGLNLHQRLS